MKKNIGYIAFLLLFFGIGASQVKVWDNPPEPEETKQIEIVYAGVLTVDEEKYPEATIFSSDQIQQVQFRHNGMDVWCDMAILYKKDNTVKAYGNVFLQQGDSLKMDSKYIEYDGNTKIAIAKKDVVLRNNDMVLESQQVIFDRNTQEAYYPVDGKITDKENVLTSRSGKYIVAEKKNQFENDVVITNPNFVLKSQRLDYYHETGYADILGSSTIDGKDYVIHTKIGFYDTKAEKGYFSKRPDIEYDNKLILGDSLYFDKVKNFSKAINNIKITDTINKIVVRGNYAEVYKAKDSMFIEKKAVVVSLAEKDSIYMHGKRILVTGGEGCRVVRAYPNARIYGKDMQGKCDSINSDEFFGLTKLIGTPVVWYGDNQVTGDNIHIKANTSTQQVDSLKVFNNAFIVEKDSLGSGYNQLIGKVMYGKFVNKKLKRIDLVQNTEVIYYAYDDKNELVGVNKTKSSRIQVRLDKDQKMDEITFYKDVDGSIFPIEKFPKEEALFPNFKWRGEERIKSKDEIFLESEGSEVLDKEVNKEGGKGKKDVLKDDKRDKDSIKAEKEDKKNDKMAVKDKKEVKKDTITNKKGV